MVAENKYLYNAMMWPLNLVRDTPRRFGRLLGTLAAASEAGPRDHIFVWLHALSWYLFDLIGGPEIAEFLLRLVTETRPLAQEEIAAAKEVLGSKAIRFQDVRIAQRGLLRYAFRSNKNRAFATWHTINLPESRQDDLPLLVHELTHVFQFERVGSVYIGQGLIAQFRHGRAAYDYGGPAALVAEHATGKRYCDYNREQQGQIAQDYCAKVQSGKDVTAYEPFIAQLRKGML